MTHFRRYEFKKRRYCSTPAVANLHDFSDHFVEQLKNKIRIDDKSNGCATGTTATILEDEECEETRLINGIKELSNRDSTQEEIENERPRKQASLKRKSLAATASPAQQDQEVPNVGGKSSGPREDSVFKSANWLSDNELIFSLSNQVGGLVRALRVFQELDIGIKHVESRPSKRRDSEFEIFVDIDCDDKDKMRKLVHHLR